MSVNNIISLEYLPAVTAFQKMIEASLDEWKQAPTLEKRFIVEHQLIQMFEEVINFSHSFEKVSPLVHPEGNSLQKEYSKLGWTWKAKLHQIRALANQYIAYFNSQQDHIASLIGSLKRSRQKLSTLRLWNRGEDKWVISESFLNWDNLELNYTKLATANIDTDSGICTLPVLEEKSIRPRKIKVSSGSNGRPGDSNLDSISVNNRLPGFTIDGSNETWFEYERLDSGPLYLNLRSEFTNNQIVNCVRIEAVNIGNSLNYKIDDIIFNTSSEDSISIKDLTYPGLSDDFYTVKTVGNSTYWEASFLPVVCTSIVIKIVQDHHYYIKTRSYDNRVVSRPRYCIALRKIDFFRKKYSVSGGINSVLISVPDGLYTSACDIKVWPRSNKLFDISANVSVDGGENWQNNIYEIDDQEGKTILCPGDAFNLVWNLELIKKENAFSDATSFTDEETSKEHDSLLTVVSSKVSPITIPLKSKPFDKKVFVMQPKIARRSSSLKDSLKLGYLTSEYVNILPLPFSLENSLVKPENIKVFIGRNEWRFVETIEELNRGTFGFTDNYENIIIDLRGTGAQGSLVRYLIDEEELLFEKRTDGYYTKTKLLFDPDKENISIKYLPYKESSKSFFLPKGRRRIFLGSKNINKETFELFCETKEFVEVEKINVVKNIDEGEGEEANEEFIENGYYFDNKNGVLLFATPIMQTIKVTFEYYNVNKIDDSKYRIWFKDSKPNGFILDTDSISTIDTTDILGKPHKIFDIRTYSYLTRGQFTGNNKNSFVLSHNKIIKNTVRINSEIFGYKDWPKPIEMPYLDGKTEFLGLIPMETEYTAYLSEDHNEVITFNLAAGNSWYKKGGLHFSSNNSSFVNEVSAQSYEVFLEKAEEIGDFAVTNEGVVYLYNNGFNKGYLQGGISLRYFYSNPSFDSRNRYSIDYENGILYLSEDIDHTKDQTIDYQSSSYTACYDICEEYNKYNYIPENNSVSIRTENLRNEFNNQAKLIWAKSPGEKSLLALKDYFSPIIHSLGFRFQ